MKILRCSGAMLDRDMSNCERLSAEDFFSEHDTTVPITPISLHSKSSGSISFTNAEVELAMEINGMSRRKALLWLNNVRAERNAKITRWAIASKRER